VGLWVCGRVGAAAARHAGCTLYRRASWPTAVPPAASRHCDRCSVAVPNPLPSFSQAHMDRHLASKLQQEEEKLDALYSRLLPSSTGRGGSGSTPAADSSKKRGAASKGGGRQATLQAMLAKRARQQQ